MVVAYRFRVMNFDDGEQSEQPTSAAALEEYFRLFGVQAILGRAFAAEEDLACGA